MIKGWMITIHCGGGGGGGGGGREWLKKCHKDYDKEQEFFDFKRADETKNR